MDTIDPKKIATYTLTDFERIELEKIAKSEISHYSCENYPNFINSCQSTIKYLPTSLLDWSKLTRKLNIGLLRNLPVDEFIPLTPLDRNGADNFEMLADSIMGMISALFGRIYTFQGKKNALHIHNIYPIKEDENTQLGSSKVELEWHVEDGFHPFRPNWISLFCIRPDLSVKTRVARVADLRISENLYNFLTAKRFKLQIDDSFKNNNELPYVITSILSGPPENQEIIFDPAFTICQTSEETEAIKTIVNEANKMQQSISLCQGDFFAFNNRKVIHARNAYTPKMDGTDRWIKRALIINETWNSQLVKGRLPLQLVPFN